MAYHLYSNGGLLNGTTKTILVLLLCGGIACCSSCVSGNAAKKNAPQPYIWLTDSYKYILLPPEDIEYPLDSHQLISASYGNNDYYLNAWVKADATGMNITMINELGANMGELSYRDGAVSFSSAMFPPSLRPEYIIADFQLCFYKASALRQALENHGLSFEEEAGRRILEGKNVIIEIEKSQNTITLINHLRGYAYTLEGDFE